MNVPANQTFQNKNWFELRYIQTNKQTWQQGAIDFIQYISISDKIFEDSRKNIMHKLHTFASDKPNTQSFKVGVSHTHSIVFTWILCLKVFSVWIFCHSNLFSFIFVRFSTTLNFRHGFWFSRHFKCLPLFDGLTFFVSVSVFNKILSIINKFLLDFSIWLKSLLLC